MKKYLLIILVIFAAVFASGCISFDESDADGIKTITKSGVVLKYPSDWIVSQSTSPNSLVSVAASNSIDSSKIGKVNVNVEKKPLTSSLDFFVNQTTSTMAKDSSFSLIYSGNAIIGDNEAIEVMYLSEVNGTLKKHKAVWMEHNGDAVVILCSAPENEFDSYSNVFNFIVQNIRLL